MCARLEERERGGELMRCGGAEAGGVSAVLSNHQATLPPRAAARSSGRKELGHRRAADQDPRVTPSRRRRIKHTSSLLRVGLAPESTRQREASAGRSSGCSGLRTRKPGELSGAVLGAAHAADAALDPSRLLLSSLRCACSSDLPDSIVEHHVCARQADRGGRWKEECGAAHGGGLGLAGPSRG
jgi:hypothetical protein